MSVFNCFAAYPPPTEGVGKMAVRVLLVRNGPTCKRHPCLSAQVKYGLLREMFRDRNLWRQLALSVLLNWVLGPLIMTGLAWACLPDEPMARFRNGVILVGLARCIAMVCEPGFYLFLPFFTIIHRFSPTLPGSSSVCGQPASDNGTLALFPLHSLLQKLIPSTQQLDLCVTQQVLIWNQLARGDAEFCAILVAVNSVLQIILYSPLALFYLKARCAHPSRTPASPTAFGVQTFCLSLSFAKQLTLSLPLLFGSHSGCPDASHSQPRCDLPRAWIQVVSHQYDVPGIDFRTIAISVLIYLGAPLVAAIATRYALIAAAGERWYNRRFLPAFGPVALLALIYTVRTAPEEARMLKPGERVRRLAR